jgi:imidazolonepropionase-like amidohydrolase
MKTAAERQGVRAGAIRVILASAVSLGSAVSAASAQTIAITGGTVVTLAGPPIANGTVVIEGGRIVAVGAAVAVPAGARTIDARGKFVYPGLIDARTQLGLTEIGSVAGGNDLAELGDFNPAMATVVAVNAHSELIPVTRVEGVTTVLSAPGGGRVAGTATVIDLDGWTPREMARVPLAALIVEYPTLERTGGGGFGGGGGGGRGGAALSDEEFTRRAERQVRELNEYFERARSYADRKARGTVPALDRQLEAMVAPVRGEMPVLVSADGAKEILGAIALADRFGLKLIVGGGRQAWRVADTLAARKIPVILGSILSSPGRDDPFDALYAQPRVLARAGVKFAFSTDGASDVRDLPYHAQMAVAHGLAADTALMALSRWPAEILGIGSEVGTIEPGKVANLFVASGSPLDVRTTVEQVFIRGLPMDGSTRHTRLYQEFRGRPRGQ